MGPHYFLAARPGGEVPCAFLHFHHFQFGSGLKLPLLGLNLGLRGPSEAPEAPEAPQRPLSGHNFGLRGPSEAPEAPEAPQRALRGPSWVSIWASEAWVSIWAWIGCQMWRSDSAALLKLPLPWRYCGGPKTILPPQCGGHWQLKYYFPAKMAASTPNITPKPPQKRSLLSPINKKPSYLRYTATNRDTDVKLTFISVLSIQVYCNAHVELLVHINTVVFFFHNHAYACTHWFVSQQSSNIIILRLHHGKTCRESVCKSCARRSISDVIVLIYAQL